MTSTITQRPAQHLATVWLAGALAIASARSASAQAAPPAPPASDKPVAQTTSTPPANVENAERAFNEAVHRMDSGDYATACPLLEQSQALDPSSGTLLNLGDCYEHEDRTASAWRAFSQARAVATATDRPDRAQVAEARVNRLLPRLRRLAIIPPQRPVADLVIRIDDQPVPAASASTPVPVDPGVHHVHANAPGMREYAVEVAAPEVGSTTALQLPELQPEGAELLVSRTSPGKESSALDGQQIAAIACGVAGVAAVTTGVVFGLSSLSQHRDSDDFCTGNFCNDARGVELMNDARTAGNLSTASFVIGGAALTAAAVLWIVRPFGKHEGVQAGLSVAPRAIALRGSW